MDSNFILRGYKIGREVGSTSINYIGLVVYLDIASRSIRGERS